MDDLESFLRRGTNCSQGRGWRIWKDEEQEWVERIFYVGESRRGERVAQQCKQAKGEWGWKRYNTEADLDRRVSHQRNFWIARSLIGHAYFKAEDKLWTECIYMSIRVTIWLFTDQSNGNEQRVMSLFVCECIPLVMRRSWHRLENAPAAKASEKPPRAHVKAECRFIPSAAEYSHVSWRMGYTPVPYWPQVPSSAWHSYIDGFQTARTSSCICLTYRNTPNTRILRYASLK